MSAMDATPTLRYVVAGRLQKDFLLLPDGSQCLDMAGGNLFYAASGLGLWERGIGLLGRVGEDYPQEWIAHAASRGFDTRGIHILPESVDLRRFIGYTPGGTALEEDPVAHFARLGLPFPKSLLDYRSPQGGIDSRTQMGPLSIRLTDIPSDYLDAGSAHICPLDYLAHTLLPSTFRQGHITTITVDAGRGYMNPAFYDAIPAVIAGLTAFITNEEKLRNLFQGRTSDLWAMADALSSYGCDLIVIKRGERGQMLLDRGTHTRWVIPAYSAHMIDPTGAGDAFCGGFLAGFRLSYDPLEAILHGNISASFAVEGTGVFYTMDAFQRLAESRLTALKDMVRKA